jgi:hypothetical protein
LSTIELPKNLAQDLAWEMVGSQFEDLGHTFKVLVNEQIDSRRWVAVCVLVVKIDDKFYKATYEKGLTEYQDSCPFEYDGDMISFERVYPRPKTVVEYVPYVEDE